MRRTALLWVLSMAGPYILYPQSGYTLETVIQQGHTAAVKSVAVSPDGRLLASGSRDKSAKIWDIHTGKEIRSFLGHEFTVNSVQFSKDGKWLLTSSTDQTARIWDIYTGKQIFKTPLADKWLTDVALSSDQQWMATGGYGDSVNVYQLPGGKKIKSIAVNSDQSNGYGIQLSFSPDGKWLAIGEDNKAVQVIETSGWTLKYQIKAREGWCGGCGTKVLFSADSKYLFKQAHNDQVLKYEVSTGNFIAAWGDKWDNIAGISLHKDGQKLVAGGDKRLDLWQTETGTKISSIETELYGEINEVVFHSDSNWIFTATSKNVLIQFDAGTGKVIKEFTGIFNQQDKGGLAYDADNYWQSHIAKYMRLKTKLLLNSNNDHFITGKTGKHATLWNISTGSPARSFIGHEQAVICFDLSKDGKRLVTGDGRGEVILWDMATGQKIQSYKAHNEPIFEVKFSPDGEQLAVSSWDATLSFWDVQSGQKLIKQDLQEYSAYSLSYTPDGLYLVTGRLDKTLELREADSKQLVKSFIGHKDVVSSIDFGREPMHMLTASWDGSARIWDISTGMLLKKFKVSSGGLHAALYSPDNKQIFTAGDDRVIRIWDIGTSKVVKTLEGHQAEITCLSISKDGKLLVSYSLDGVIKVWDLTKGQEFYEHIHLGDSEWMARTKSGYYNATAGARSLVHFVKGLEIYHTEQFFEDYYRPDLLPELFRNRDLPVNGSMGLDDRIQKFPAPLVKLVLLPQENGRTVQLQVRVTDNGGGIDELRISHNGKILPLAKGEFQPLSGKGTSSIYKKEYPLINGINTFSVTSFSKGRVESRPAESQIYSEVAANETVCHILVIGINTYQNASLSLNYARQDAESVVSTMQKAGKNLFKEVKVYSLYDAEATRKNILDTLNHLASKVALHDVFMFFYAGHGSMKDDQFFFIPTECTRLYDLASLQKYALPALELQEKLRKIKALKQMIIMDACHSGGAVEMMAARGGLEEKAIAQLSRSAGIHVMASAGSEQTAKEMTSLKHGLFTYVLLKALDGDADGAPADGKITIYELKSYLDDQVPELNKEYSGKMQYPYTFSKGQDFPILLLK